MAHEGHGNHWQSVLGDVEEIDRWLPLALQQGRLDHGSKASPAAGEAIGIIWPDSHLCCLSIVSAASENPKPELVLTSAYPFAARGTRHRLKVDEIVPWQNGLEAWIKTRVPGIDGLSLTFFDSRYYASRDRLSVGVEAEFIIAGLAYTAEVAHPEIVRIDEPEKIRAMRAGTERADDLSPIEIDLKGAAILFARDEYAPDEYEFSGPVRTIESFDAFGTRITCLTSTLLRLVDSDDLDFDVTLYISDHAWRTNERALPGADVRGFLWLQGYLAT